MALTIEQHLTRLLPEVFHSTKESVFDYLLPKWKQFQVSYEFHPSKLIQQCQFPARNLCMEANLFLFNV